MTAPRIRASIVIENFAGSPDDLTRALSVEPTSTWVKGDLVRAPAILKLSNGWLLAAPEDVSGDLAVSLSWLLDKVATSANLGIGTDERTITLSCGVTIVDRAPSMCIERDLLARIVALGADLDVDIVLSERR
jgi:hypothetical protein